MNFSETVFILFFLPLTLFLYFLFPKEKRDGALLFSSLLFYLWGGIHAFFCLFFCAALSFFCGKAILFSAARGKKGRLPFAVGVGLQVLLFLLARYGYPVFYRFSLPSLELPPLNTPFALAFLVIKGISLLAECKSGSVKAVSFGKTTLYLSLFFNVSGPAVCYDEFSSVFAGKNQSDSKNGFYLFALGFCKKLILAESLSALWREVGAENAVHLSTLSVLLATAAFFLAVCMGMSAYSDMAEGLGLIFGYTLRKNTDYPLLALSVSEFWRRFLSGVRRFFSIYLEQPLSKGKKRGVQAAVGTLAAYIAMGLFFGGGLSYLVFGLVFGLAAVIENQTALPEKLSFPLRRFFTMLIAVFAFSFCGAGSLKRWSALFRVVLGKNGFVVKGDGYLLSSYWLLLLLCVLVGGRFFEKPLSRFHRKYPRLEKITKPIFTLFLFFVSVAFLVNISESSYIFLPL